MNRKQKNMLGMPGNYEKGIPAVVTGILVNNTFNNVPPEEDISSKFWVIGAALSILFVFLRYIFSKKTKMDIIPDIKKYEQQFEEEYRNFVSETDEPNQKKNPVSNDTSALEDKL